MASGTGNQDIARRYATAFFALAQEQSQIDQIAKDMHSLETLLAQGGDFAAFALNTTLRRDEQAGAVVAVAKHLKLVSLTEKFLGTLAQKRRLPALSVIVAAVLALIAEHKGELTADVTAAQALTQSQIDAIAANLKKSLGKTVKVRLKTDPAIMGGLVIRVGSKLIDSSVSTKLERLHRALKNTNDTTTQKKMKEVA